MSETKRIGLIIGREWSWPQALINEVNSREAEVVAEFVELGGTFMGELCPYAVIFDRISHEIPYYRIYIKYAALQGCYVINNPFTASADDRFFGIALLHTLNVKVPRTVVLPNKGVEAESVPESFRNLKYPMDWDGIINYVGVPAILKDSRAGISRRSYWVRDVASLIQCYDESDTATMVLQQIIESDIHIHCFVIGQEHVLAMRYDKEAARYKEHEPFQGLDPSLEPRMIRAARIISQAFSYDVNMVEFVVKDREPYVINATYPTPDLDVNRMAAAHFNWCVQKMADFAIEIALNPRPQLSGYAWQKLLEEYGHDE
jgi:hypothetical protein